MSGGFHKIAFQVCSFLFYPSSLLLALSRNKNIENKTMTLKKNHLISVSSQGLSSKL